MISPCSAVSIWSNNNNNRCLFITSCAAGVAGNRAPQRRSAIRIQRLQQRVSGVVIQTDQHVMRQRMAA